MSPIWIALLFISGTFNVIAAVLVIGLAKRCAGLDEQRLTFLRRAQVLAKMFVLATNDEKMAASALTGQYDELADESDPQQFALRLQAHERVN